MGPTSISNVTQIFTRFLLSFLYKVNYQEFSQLANGYLSLSLKIFPIFEALNSNFLQFVSNFSPKSLSFLFLSFIKFTLNNNFFHILFKFFGRIAQIKKKSLILCFTVKSFDSFFRNFINFFT